MRRRLDDRRRRRLTSPTIDSTAPTGSSARGEGSFESGTIRRPGIRATITTGTFTRKTEPHQKWLSSQPPTIGPIAMPEAGDAGPDADRAAALIGREDVGEDRQGRRHDQRAADAHERAGRDQRARRCRRTPTAPSRRRRSTRPSGERLAAAEPVAEAARGEQQPGEHQRCRRRPSTAAGCWSRRGRATSVGQRDVEDRVVEPDHEEAQAEDPEDPPAPLVPFGVFHGHILSATHAYRNHT